jgi:hypothetical protein
MSNLLIVTLPEGYLDNTDGLSAAARQSALLRAVYSAIDGNVTLERPDSWPTEVWVAFERAQAERTQRNVEATNGRRDTGNTLVHPSTRNGQPVVCQNTISPAETLADHSPRHFPVDTGERTPPHGDHLRDA